MRFSDDSPDLARLADSSNPAFLFDGQGALVWANAAAAVYWGTPRRAGLMATDFTRHAVAEQARALARSLPEGPGRLERLRLVPFGRNTPLVAQVRRLNGADGAGAVLVTALERVASGRVATLRAAEAAEAPPPLAAAPAPTQAEPVAAADEPAAVPQAAESAPAVPDVAEDVTGEAAEIPAAAEAARQGDEIADEAAAGDAPAAATAQAEEPPAAAAEAAAPAEQAAPETPPVAEAPEASPPGPSPRAAAIASRVRPLRFAWQTDPQGRFSQVSPDFVAAVGAEAMPGAQETVAAFAARAGLDDGAFAERLASGGGFAATMVAWPLHEGSERALVELAAVPVAGGYRGFGILRGLAPEPPAPEAEAPAAVAPVTAEPAEAEPAAEQAAESEATVALPETPGDAPSEAAEAPSETAPSEVTEAEPVAAEPGAEAPPAVEATEEPQAAAVLAEPSADGASEEPAAPAPAESASDAPAAGEATPREDVAPREPTPVGLAAAANANVLRFPGAAAAPTERRLAPSDEAALRTIARVLGGPIAVTANEPAPPAAPARESEPAPPPEPAQAEAPAVPSALFAAAAADDSELAELRQALDAARSRESELRGILDTASDGVVIIDGAGLIESLNRSAEALFGVESGEIAGQPFLRLMAPESQRAAADYLDGLAQHGVASLLNDGREVVGLERNGGTIPLFMTMGRLASSIAGERTCAVLRDITQWKSAERELTEAKRQAERASHQKSDFLAKISHEIRTPLNAIIGFSEVMLEERFGRIENERYRGYLADIRASGEHLLSLVNDLLDLSKIESGRIDLIFGQVKLADIAQQAVATMQPQANREGVILRTSLPPVAPVVADARSIRQILFNLLSNAVKFTRSGGQVIVSLAATDAGEIALRVRDTGIGMNPSEIAMAMEPFRQVATRSRFDGEGTGLGLPLTKALAEANRAAFTIDSHPGEGTLVQIVFPTTRVLAE